MYGRYIGFGENVNQAFLYCRINQMGHDGCIKYKKISFKTETMIIDKIKGYSASHMELLISFGYKYFKDKNNFSNTEYDSYKKLIVFFGKDKLYEIFGYYTNDRKCLALKEANYTYRFIYLN